MSDVHEYIMLELEEHGSATERDISRMGSDPYKPFYRALAIVVAGYDNEGYDTNPVWHEISDGNRPTLEQAKQVISEAHPWFKDAIERNPERFETTYEFMVEAWQ